MPGYLYRRGGNSLVRIDGLYVGNEVMVKQRPSSEGPYVLVEVLPTRSAAYQRGRIVRVLGDPYTPGIEVEMAIRGYEIPRDWPADVEQEARLLPSTVEPGMAAGRCDIRDLPLVTIDGPDARDFDDAVYCSQTAKGWRLIVAIADVSHYVQPGGSLDRAARVRGNSVYFHSVVIPMLPESLANGICSLQADKDRLCLYCDMQIDAQGRIQAYSFHEGIMCSRARLTYPAVSAFLAGDGSAIPTWLQPHLRNLQHLHRRLLERREQRGAIDLDIPEIRVLQRGDRVTGLAVRQRNDAHRIIEEAMIAANVCAATLLSNSGIACPYRVHDVPQRDRIVQLRRTLAVVGLDAEVFAAPEPRDYQRLVAQLRELPYGKMLLPRVTRSLARAAYDVKNIGHYGLALDAYTHFTSPIRRYSDLLTHRLIRGVLSASSSSAPEATRTPPHSGEDLRGSLLLANAAEERARSATYAVQSWLVCRYMEQCRGEQYRAWVVDVLPIGLLLVLEDSLVRGMAPIRVISRCYAERFYFDPGRLSLCGASGREFHIGDMLSVRLERVSWKHRRMDFAPVAPPSGGRRLR